MIAAQPGVGVTAERNISVALRRHRAPGGPGRTVKPVGQPLFGHPAGTERNRRHRLRIAVAGFSAGKEGLRIRSAERKPVLIRRIVAPEAGHQVFLMVRGVLGHGQADLFQLVDAADRARPDARPVQRRQQKRGENRDDRNHDQQFDQSECFFPHRAVLLWLLFEKKKRSCRHTVVG